MTDVFRQDIQAMYALADRCDRLDALVPSLCDVLRRNGDSLADVTYAYRMVATDTGYGYAFSLDHGRFSELTAEDRVSVTIAGPERNLLAVFQRKLNPMKALLLGKIKVHGSRDALLKLAAFL